MKIIKRALLATIGLALAVSVSATPIQSDGTLTLTSNIIIDSQFDTQIKESQNTLSISHDALTVNAIETLDFRSPKFKRSSINDNRVSIAPSKTMNIIGSSSKRHEVGWQV
jgi:hypothetical protein